MTTRELVDLLLAYGPHVEVTTCDGPITDLWFNSNTNTVEIEFERERDE